MNDQLQKFARDELKKALAKCTQAQQHRFKQMYAHKNLDLPIEEAVDQMPEERLDWAMTQVNRTIAKNMEEA